METVVTILERSFSLAVGIVIGHMLFRVCDSWLCYYLNKRHVLAAIKDLGIEDKLAQEPALMGDSFRAINEWLAAHQYKTFEGRGSAFDMHIMIGELRRSGMIK